MSAVMSDAVGMPRESRLAGWPFWASVITHVVGLGAVSAVAVTSTSTAPPPVPIELVTIERPVPPFEIPEPKVVKAPPTQPVLHQPASAPASVSSEPAPLMDDAPRAEKAEPLPDPIAPDRRFFASAAPSISSTSNGIPAGAGALFATGDLRVAGTGASGGRGGTGTGQTIASTGSPAGLTELARPLGGYQTTPRYPESARRQGVEGITTLRFVVLANGHVGQIAVARSAGHVDLDRAAMEAVRTWHFEPARRGKEAVAVWVTLPVRFELHNE
jgi:periplasmic protein TonB